jgi:hypothetical protein
VSKTQNIPPLWLRGVIFIFAVILIFWLPVEDATAETPFLFSIIAGSLLTLLASTKIHIPPCQLIWIRYPIAGVVTGFIIPFVAVLLMLFKSGLHGHGFPDFTTLQYISILQRTPGLMAVGVFVGFARSFWQWRRCPK